MIVIGLTGGIATGKSTVTAALRDLGVPVIDADQVARQVVEPGQPALDEIVAAFGPDLLRDDGRLDREKLASLVFADGAARQRLNSITHPHILRAIDRQRQEAAAAGQRVLALDVPLLFEAGMDRSVDRVWVVTASPSQQLQRLMGRDGLTAEEARRRVESQMPLEEKIRRADAVIDNSGSVEATRTRVRNLLEALLDSDQDGSR
ncbi:MAG: dephospho-CoA kinase [Bacillota bacterium]